MQIALWPLVGRELLIRFFRPGDETASDAPFRTLRRHEWATAGVRISTREGGRAAGQVTVFSTLNLEAVRLARCAQEGPAMRFAREAAALEESPDFVLLGRLLSGLSPEVVVAVVHGVVPPSLPNCDKVWLLLTRIARRTERIRSSPSVKSSLAEVCTGRVSAVQGTVVVMTTAGGQSSMIPLWLAHSVGRERVGDELAVVTDRLDESSALSVALPALDVDGPRPAPELDPFARDARAGALSASDMRKLAGVPAPPRVLVPVTIAG